MGNDSLTRIVRLFCLIELFALLPFAIPILNMRHLGILDWVNQLLGGSAFPPIDSLHLAIAGVAGFISLGFVIIRWNNPTPEIATIEGFIRIGVACWLLWAGWVLSAPLFIGLAVLDYVGGGLHLWAARNHDPSKPEN